MESSRRGCSVHVFFHLLAVGTPMGTPAESSPRTSFSSLGAAEWPPSEDSNLRGDAPLHSWPQSGVGLSMELNASLLIRRMASRETKITAIERGRQRGSSVSTRVPRTGAGGGESAVYLPGSHTARHAPRTHEGCRCRGTSRPDCQPITQKVHFCELGHVVCEQSYLFYPDSVAGGLRREREECAGGSRAWRGTEPSWKRLRRQGRGRPAPPRPLIHSGAA